MCVYCGELITSFHWSAEGESLPGRLKKVAAAGRILKFYGLDLAQWQGVRYILRNRTGRSELIADLGQVWEAAARLAGREVDLLDPALLDFLRGQ